VPDHPLTQRVQKYLARQTAWFEAQLEQVDAHLRDLEQADPDLDAIAAAQEKRFRELEHFVRESQALSREWKASEDAIPRPERDAVRALSVNSRQLANVLEERMMAASRVAAAAAEERRKACADTRKGRRQLRKYHPTDNKDAGRIDRQA
jgi:septal ring factor EnvC (AmiA/AmiB activator)